MGRPKLVLPENFNDVLQEYFDKNITSGQAAEILKMPISTFFKYLSIEKQKMFLIS